MPCPCWTALLQQLAEFTCAAFSLHALPASSPWVPVFENPVAAAFVTAVNSSGVWLLSL